MLYFGECPRSVNFAGMGKREDKLNDYEGFVDKFKPKLTTDDCYTPPEIYDGVVEYVGSRITDLSGMEIVRPFWPGADYQTYDYPDNAVVIDNPPFSILASIVDWYTARGIRFWLFAPSLTLLQRPRPGVTYVCAHAEVTYENGATVRTSFVTNIYPGDYIMVADGDLYTHLTAINDSLRRAKAKKITKRVYPDNLVTSALLGKVVCRGVSLKIPRESAHFVRRLDCMTGESGIYGGALLLSDKLADTKAAAERAAAERAAAERAAAERAASERAASERHNLSEREIAIIKGLK